MTLSDFILAKPSELRLGQWFYNCYGRWSSFPKIIALHWNELYNIRDDVKATHMIEDIMRDYQWKELPEWRNINER